MQRRQPSTGMEISRIVGRHRGEAAGPTVICVAGIHGNEAAGIEALRLVFASLQQDPAVFRGELLGIAGNLAALAAGERFLVKDLNRQWTADRMAAPAGPAGPKCAEDVELLELRAVVGSAIEESRGEVYFLDLHTTSGPSVPFGIIGDTLPNRSFALHFPVPIVLGLEEMVIGTLPEYAYGLGAVTMGFESGQHEDPCSVELHEAAIRVALAAAGNVPSSTPIHRTRGYRVLAEAARGYPRFLEIRHRHAVSERHRFRMQPGFRNFQPVEKGERLGRHDDAELYASEDALLFMPLYQERGDDGFFLARPIRPIWLKISTVLRHLRLGAIVHWLPGVRRHPSLPYTVAVRTDIARWYVTEIFHLLGYRRRHTENGRLVFARRQHDLWQRRRRGPDPAHSPR